MTAPGADSGALREALANVILGDGRLVSNRGIAATLADALLPVVEDFARRRAAEELEDAAALMGHRPGSHLFLRAAALAATDDGRTGE